mgnify:CR=1 FL=1
MSFDFAVINKQFDGVIEAVKEDLKTLKTGRAKPALVEDVKVEAYGGFMPLKEVASISAPDPHLITISPWDKSLLGKIEKALNSGQNQFNPVVDGDLIRIAIPQLTGEKREQMVKLVAQKIEGGKQMLRSERTNAKKHIEAQKGQDGISEDDIEQDLTNLDEKSKQYSEKLEKMGEEKATELRTV